MKGRVHSILTLSGIDGPGLRFVIFLQGCILRCLYCHNPDAWDFNRGREYTVEELLKEIDRNRIFYETSGGGVTISGGEPLCQPEFTTSILKGCRESGLHTALDTSGCLYMEDFVNIIEYTDLFILDIKGVDEKSYIKMTGKKGESSLKNGRFLSSLGKKLHIRYVVVPGYNDSLTTINTLVEQLSEIDTVTRVQIVPYSTLGVEKRKNLGINNPLDGVKPPDNMKLNWIRERIREKKPKVEVV